MPSDIPQELRKSTDAQLVLPPNFLANSVFLWATYHIALWHILFLVNFFQQSLPSLDLWDFYLHFASQAWPIAVTAVLAAPILVHGLTYSTQAFSASLMVVQNVFRKLREGEKVDAIQLRQNDPMSGLEDEVNEFLRWYTEKNRFDPANLPPAMNDTEKDVLKRLAELKKTTRGIRAVTETMPQFSPTTLRHRESE